MCIGAAPFNWKFVITYHYFGCEQGTPTSAGALLSGVAARPSKDYAGLIVTALTIPKRLRVPASALFPHPDTLRRNAQNRSNPASAAVGHVVRLTGGVFAALRLRLNSRLQFRLPLN
jgi:hypothetical protein